MLGSDKDTLPGATLGATLGATGATGATLCDTSCNILGYFRLRGIEWYLKSLYWGPN